MGPAGVQCGRRAVPLCRLRISLVLLCVIVLGLAGRPLHLRDDGVKSQPCVVSVGSPPLRAVGPSRAAFAQRLLPWRLLSESPIASPIESQIFPWRIAAITASVRGGHFRRCRYRGSAEGCCSWMTRPSRDLKRAVCGRSPAKVRQWAEGRLPRDHPREAAQRQGSKATGNNCSYTVYVLTAPVLDCAQAPLSRESSSSYLCAILVVVLGDACSGL